MFSHRFLREILILMKHWVSWPHAWGNTETGLWACVCVCECCSASSTSSLSLCIFVPWCCNSAICPSWESGAVCFVTWLPSLNLSPRPVYTKMSPIGTTRILALSCTGSNSILKWVHYDNIAPSVVLLLLKHNCNILHSICIYFLLKDAFLYWNDKTNQSKRNLCKLVLSKDSHRCSVIK